MSFPRKPDNHLHHGIPLGTAGHMDTKQRKDAPAKLAKHVEKDIRKMPLIAIPWVEAKLTRTGWQHDGALQQSN